MNSLATHFGHSPLRAVITNGSWLILFTNPGHTFFEDIIDLEDITIYSDSSDILKRAAEIWEYLELFNSQSGTALMSASMRVLYLGLVLD